MLSTKSPTYSRTKSANMVSTFTFSSPWALSQLARENFLRSFKLHLAGPSVEILSSGHREEWISLRCSEESFLSFVSHAAAFYKAEREAQRDVFDTPEIRRLDGTSAMTAEPSLKRDRAQWESQENVLIAHENHCQSWKPARKSAHRHTSIYSLPTILGRIETTTFVRIEKLQDRLILKGDTEKATAKAIEKLNVIEEAMAHQPITRNYLVLEGTISYKLRMVSLKEVPDSRLKTTLLSPRSSYHQNIASCRIVCMIKDGAVCKADPLVRSDDATYLWQGHHFSMQSSYQEVPNAIARTPIIDWITTSSTAPIMDPFIPSYGDFAPLAQRNEDPFLSPWSENVSTASEIPQSASTSTAATSHSRSNAVSTFNKIGGAEQTGPQYAAVEPVNLGSAIGKGCCQCNDDLAAQDAPSHFRMTGQDNIGPLRQQPPVIRGPFMPSPSQTASIEQQHASRSWEDYIVLPERTTDTLIETEDSSANSHLNSIRTQNRYQTMKQRKPQIAVGDTAHFKIIQQDIVDMLGTAISHPSIQLRADVGRILIDRSSIPHDFRKGDFEAKSWASAAIGMKTDFTRMLTAKFSDMNTILNLKLKHSRPIFAAVPSDRKVVYIIEGQTKSNETITVEVNDDKVFKIRGSRVVNGAVNWHFVKRVWDAQLVLSSKNFIGGDYVREIQSMVESITRAQSPSGNELEFSFRSNGSNFEFQSMFIRRETIHISHMYPDLLLHLTEVQDLRLGHDQDDLDRYIGNMGLQNEMVNSNRLWWEVSLSSQRVSDILNENNDLELGEKGKWKPDQVLETGAVADLYTLAQEIVTRIDHVGRDNRGHATSGGKSTTKLSSHELPTGPYGFW